MPKPDDEDLHNPFGGAQTPVKKKEPPGIFDAGYEGSEDDPFRASDEERDDEWDEEEEKGTESG